MKAEQIEQILIQFLQEGGNNIQQLITLLAIKRLVNPLAGEIRPKSSNIQAFRQHLKNLERLGFVQSYQEEGKWEWPRWKLTEQSETFFKNTNL